MGEISRAEWGLAMALVPPNGLALLSCSGRVWLNHRARQGSGERETGVVLANLPYLERLHHGPSRQRNQTQATERKQRKTYRNGVDVGLPQAV